MIIGSAIASVRRLPRVDVDRAALSGLVLVLLAIAVAFAGLRLTTPSDGTDVGGPGNPFAAGAVTVDALAGGGLRDGDRVVAFLGRTVEQWAAALLDGGESRPAIATGDAITYTVERDGQWVDVVVTAGPFDGLAALGREWGVLVLALSIQLVGLYLFVRRPDEPAARALLVTGTGMFASSVPWALGMQATDLATGTGFWLYAAAAGLAYALFWCGALHFALVFPRPHPLIERQGRLLACAYVLPMGAQLLLIAGATLATGRAMPALEAWMTGQVLLQVVVIVAAVVLFGRGYWRLDDPVGRLQLRWVAAGVALAALAGLALWFGPELVIGEPLVPRSAVALLGLPFPVALAAAVGRYHLFDLDLALNRSLVYGGLTAGVVATYAVTVVLLGNLIPGNAPFAVALLGTGAVAVVALPLRDGLQRSVNRVMYGDRDEPDRALRRLGQRLETSLDPQTVLPTLVETVADALRLPFVAIELEGDGMVRTEAAHGTLPIDAAGPRHLVRVPIVYRGQQVGRLVLAPRGPGERFGAADERLLADLARQAAPAVEAVRLTADLRRSREALVATREEERRRLRRDLHDELGPTLAGTLMRIGAARSLIEEDPGRARRLLDDLGTDLRAMIEEIRRIAHNLRPPALDELGLVGALRQHAATFDGGTSERPLRVSCRAPDELPPLPAAVEVAALRIALEALANAARHSHASRVSLGLTLDGDFLVVTVQDDGIGLPLGVSPGVGLTSMRERADELGGTLIVDGTRGTGTTIAARLPLAGGSR